MTPHPITSICCNWGPPSKKKALGKQRLESNAICIIGSTERGSLALFATSREGIFKKVFTATESPWRNSTSLMEEAEESKAEQPRPGRTETWRMPVWKTPWAWPKHSHVSPRHKPLLQGKSILPLILEICSRPTQFRAAERWGRDQGAQRKDAGAPWSLEDSPLPQFGKPADALLFHIPLWEALGARSLSAQI